MKVNHFFKAVTLYLVSTVGLLMAQATGSIQGNVATEDGSPLPGANVIVAGTQYGGTTDSDGHYAIDVPAGTYSVRAEYIGYESATVENVVVTAGETSQANFSLTASALAGEEVIVTALGIKKEKKALTYAAQDIKADELTRVKNANLFNNLSGRIAGVAVRRSASGTGGTVKLTIRGNSSVRNNQPLYVIDGVPVSNVSPSQANSTWEGRDGGDAVSLINPEDVESMTVLKGASASALYGSQGANGVIIINTKKGEAGKAVITVSSSTVMDNVVNLPEFQTSYGAAEGAESSWDGGKKSSPNHVPGFFNTGMTKINSVTLSSGTAKAQSFFSFSNTDVTGVIPTNTLEKNNFSLRGTASLLDDKLTVGASVTVADQKIHNKPTSGYYHNVLTGLYWFPRGNNFDSYKTNFESLNETRNLMAQNWLTDSHTDQNPFWILHRNATEERNRRVMVATSFDYAVNDNLNIASRISTDNFYNTYERKIYATTQGTLSHPNGRYRYSRSNDTQFFADIIATYNKKVSDDLDLTVIGGSSVRNTRIGDGISLDSGTNPGLNKANWFTLANFNGVNSLSQGIRSKKEIQSMFGSAQIGYQRKIYLDVSARNDKSSALVGTDNESYFYPSFGLSAILTELVSLPSVVDFAKVRVSQSTVGNDIPAFITSPRNSISAGAVSGPSVGPRPGVSLQPELQKSFEFGTEWKLFDNRLGFDLTVYNSTTENQYITVGAPSTNPFGYSSYAFNAASIENKGMELSLYATPVRSSGLNWTTTLNYASNKNNVSGIPEELSGRLILTSSNGYQYVIENGKPFGVIEASSLLRDSQGRIQLDASGGLQKTGWEDVGNAMPDFTLGWSNQVTFNNFTLNVLIDGRFGGKVMSITEGMNDMFGVSKRSGDARDAGGVKINAVDASGNAVTTYDAKAYYSLIGNRAGALGEYMYDATNISIRELSLSYKLGIDLPYIKAASVSLVGRNLGFLMKKAPFDPNITLSTGEGFQGVDNFGQPLTRSIGVNLNLTF